MDRKHADPVTRAVPGVTVTGPGNAAPDPVTGPVTGRVTLSPETPAVTGNTAAPVAVVPVPAVARAGIALRYHARELWLDPGRLLHSLYHGKPGSMAEHMAYLKSAAWVPEEMTGKPRTFLVAAGIAYQIVAWPLMAAAKAVGAAAPHPLCMLALVVLVILLIVLL